MSALALYLAVAAALFILWSRHVQRVTVAAAIVVVLLPFCFTGKALLTGQVYAPIDLPFMSEPLKDYQADYGITRIHNATLSDVYCQIIPWRKAVRYAYSIGEWPLWNPFMLCGDILAQAAQPAPYDPFNLLSMLIPFASSLTFAAVITFFLAAFSTFTFARSTGLREWPSVLAAAAYMYCGILAFFVAWPLARAWALMPFVLFAVRLLVHERTVRAAGFLVAALTLEVFAGHPESLLHITFVGVLYGLFELATVRRGTQRAITLALAAGVVTLCLTAIFLIPFIEATTQTYETVIRTEHFSRMPIDTSPEHVGMRAGLAFFPWFGLRHEGRDITPFWDAEIARVGGLVLALALASLVLAPRRGATWFFFALAVFSLWSAFDAPPVADWLHAIPLFNIALNDRLAFAACFALAMLAAIAADSWPSGRNRFAAAAVMLACTGALAIATWLTYKPHADLGMNPPYIKLLAAIDLVPIVLVAALLLLRVNHRIAVPIILALVLAQRTAEDGGFYPSVPQEAFYPRVPVIEAIPPSAEPFRMIGRDYALVPSSAALYQLEDARGYEAMTFLRLAETFPLWSIPQPVWFNRVADLDRPFLSMINVRYAISPGEIAIPDGWRRKMSDRNSTLLENTRVLPRAFVPRRVRYEQNGPEVLKGMRSATDFTEVGWILAPEVGPHDAPNGPGRISIRRDGLAYQIDAVMENDGWVIVSNSAWKGWRAYTGGRRIQTRFANHAVIGVHVPRGTHRIRLVYLPQSFVIGRAVSFATLLLIVIASAAAWWRRRARRGMAPTPA
ncbi:MAG: YfhO family protein [Thermoanaerobaculia bacterium]